jgi:hypothetical protein
MFRSKGEEVTPSMRRNAASFLRGEADPDTAFPFDPGSHKMLHRASVNPVRVSLHAERLINAMSNHNGRSHKSNLSSPISPNCLFPTS